MGKVGGGGHILKSLPDMPRMIVFLVILALRHRYSKVAPRYASYDSVSCNLGPKAQVLMSLGKSILSTIHTCIVGFVQESINTDTSEWGKNPKRIMKVINS